MIEFELKAFDFDLPEIKIELDPSLAPFCLDDSVKRKMVHEDYREMITGHAWRQTRNRIISERKQCEWCGSTDRLEVHHLSYDQPPDDPEYDLVVLCLKHHRYAHTRADLGRSFMHEDRWILDFELQLEKLSNNLLG